MSEQEVKSLKSRVSKFRGGSQVVKAEIVDEPSSLVISAMEGKRFHFIGAGGIGMSGLAQLLLRNKAIVTGSDQAGSKITEKLCQLGAGVRIGHSTDNLVPGTDAVVVSAAIKENNPELQIARRKGLKVYKYAQMLGRLMSCYRGIAVSGTHGKSTTSGWLAYCLKCAGLQPNFIIGAEITQLGVSSGTGDGSIFVAEACEYDRSFLNLRPKIGCILNIEQDHLDYYRDEHKIVEAFSEFARGIEPGGVLVANGQDANVAKVLMDVSSNAELICRTFGFDKSCDFCAQNLELKDGLYSFDVYFGGEFLGSAGISLPGKHNVLNALAVVAMAVSAGVEPQRILELLGEFAGMERRIELKGRFGGITVLDDYAHHPTEIRASLEAIQQRYAPKRIWCVFQPHQYSRTRFLLDDFAESFMLADVTIVPEIYFVRDSKSAKEQVNSQILAERICRRGGEALFIDSFDEICDYLKKNVGVDELVVTMGAGDVWKVADEYIQWLRENS